MKTIKIDDFIKGKRIGSGGFAEVYLVANKHTEKVYAAKRMIKYLILNPTKEDMEDLNQDDLAIIDGFNREIEILSIISHPSIISFYGYSPIFFDHNPNPTILLEYASRRSLSEILNLEKSSRAPEDWDSTKKFINIYGIAKGMEFLHEKNVIHRDLKPENIMLNESLYPKIADFGLSKIYDPIQNSISKICGTPSYMAPELFESDEYTNKVDVYAFSMIVYEILTLERPFFGITPFRAAQMVLSNKRPPIPYDNTIPKEFIDLIKHCWNGDSESRPTFSEICKKLESNNFQIGKKMNIDELAFDDYLAYLQDSAQKDESAAINDHIKADNINNNPIKKAKSDCPLEEKKKSNIVQFDLSSNEKTKEDKTSKQETNDKTNKEGKDGKNSKDEKSNKGSKEKKDSKNGKADGDREHNIEFIKSKSENDVIQSLPSIYPTLEFNSLNDSCKKLVEDAEKIDSYSMIIVGKSLIEGSNNFPQNVELGIKFLQKAIAFKNQESMILYGEMLLNGNQVPQDKKEGIELLKRASNEFNNSKAKFIMAEYYLIPPINENGDFITPPNYVQAKRYSKEAADNGNIDAMVLYAKLCMKDKNNEHGRIRRNIQEAQKYFRVAISQGSGEAMALYGQILESGYGIKEESKEDIKDLYKKSYKKGSYTGGALYGYSQIKSKKKEKEGLKKVIESKEANNSTGLNIYGKIVLNGLCDLPTNLKEAANCFKEASASGNPNAMYNYAQCLEKGNGVDKNPKEAFKYYKKAFEEGEICAAKNITQMLFKGNEQNKFPKFLEDGNNYLKFLADYGNIAGINLYALNLLEGFGIEKNVKKSVFYMKNGIEKNDSNSCLLYGLFLLKEENEGNKEINTSNASKYIEKAVKAGNKKAIEKHDIYLKGGKFAQNNLDEFIKFIRDVYNKD